MGKPKSRAQIRRQRANKGRAPFRKDTRHYWLEENTESRVAALQAKHRIQAVLGRPEPKSDYVDFKTLPEVGPLTRLD